MSDDFFFDDIVLDEDALAILDAEESKYFGTVASVQPDPRPAPTQPTPPPAKRRRTDGDGGWKGPATEIGGRSGKLVSQNQKRSDSFYEDLPNISLAGDGVYGVHSQGSQPLQNSNLTPSGTKNVENPLGQRQQSTWSQQTVTAPIPVPVPAPPPRERTSNLNQNRPPPRPPPQRVHTPPSNVPRDPNNSNRPQSQQRYLQRQPSHPQQQHPGQSRGPVPRTGLAPLQPNRPQNLGPGRNVNAPRQQPLQQQTRHVTTAPVQSGPPNATGSQVTDNDLQAEVARLRVQLERMNSQQESMQKAFTEEQDARFQNQGEVSILRKRMEKLTEEHNTNAKRLRAAKEAAEAAQAQIQKDTREEIERIKTQFTFKQHEIEASLRKPTYSGRNRNKPVPSNTTKDRFSGGGAGSSELPSTPWGRTPVPNRNTTPSKSRIGDFLSPGPMLGPNSPKRSQQRPVSQMALPGFKNAFETSPKRSPGKGITKHMPIPFPPLSSANGHVEAEGEWGAGVGGDGSPGGRKWKGKEKALEPIEDSDGVPMLVLSVNSPIPKPTQAQRPVTPRSVGTQLGVCSSPLASQFGDVGELGLADLDGREGEENDGDEFLPLSLAGELHHRIFTHIRPSASKTTVQLLIALELPEPATQDDRLTLKASTMELWNVLNSLASFDIVSIDQQYRRVANSLTRIAYILNKLKLIHVLAAVFSLLGTLIFFIPRFCGALLSEGDSGNSSSPIATTNPDGSQAMITSILRDVIRTYFVPPHSALPPKSLVRSKPREIDEPEADLGREVLGLLEALCSGAPDNLESRLADVISAEGVLDTLVDPRQPSWFLYSASRALALFTSRKELYKRFLSVPGTNLNPSQGGDLDMGIDPDIEIVQEDVKLPHLECLCLHLGDHTRDTDEAERARNGIVTVIATLAVAHEEARAILLSSDTLTNALISRMNHLTSLLWEDDLQTMSSGELINATSRALSRTLFVFHYLLFANHPRAPFDLKQKIRAAPPSAAVDHMFNVTFGRLSFALDLKNVPEEAGRVLRRIINSNIVNDILQLVVDMPEDQDLIWQAYQDEPCDDEEEARMLEANEM